MQGLTWCRVIAADRVRIAELILTEVNEASEDRLGLVDRYTVQAPTPRIAS